MGKADGKLKVVTKLSCPGGWSGFMRVRETHDTMMDQIIVGEREVTVAHSVETQEWTVIDSQPYVPPDEPDSPPVDRARVFFRGQVDATNHKTTTGQDCTRTSVATESGSGSSLDSFDFSPPNAGMYRWSLGDIGPGFKANTLLTVTACGGGYEMSGTRQHAELVAELFYAEDLAILTEDPKNPGHFRGTANPIHIVSPQTGGQSLDDVVVEWDLQRKRQP
jgi:hypothetical protein